MLSKKNKPQFTPQIDLALTPAPFKFEPSIFSAAKPTVVVTSTLPAPVQPTAAPKAKPTSPLVVS